MPEWCLRKYKTPPNEIAKPIQDYQSQFSKKIGILKGIQAEMKIQLENSIIQLENSEERCTHRTDQVEDRLSEVEDKLEELDNTSKECEKGRNCGECRAPRKGHGKRRGRRSQIRAVDQIPAKIIEENYSLQTKERPTHTSTISTQNPR